MAGYEEHDASFRCVCCGRDVFGKAYRPPVVAAKLVFYSGVVLAVVGGITSFSLLIASNAQTHLIGWFVAFTFASVAVITSMYDISRHLLFYVEPELQVHYVRILWMVVIYAIESWLSLRYRSVAIYLETAREAYEAFVLWSFYRLLLSFLAAEHGVGWVVSSPSGTMTLATREEAVRSGLSSDVVMGAIMRHSCNEAILRRKELEGKLDGVLGRAGDGAVEEGVVRLSESGRGATPKASVAPEAASSGAAGEEDLVSIHIAPCCCLPAWRIGTPFLHWTRMAVFQYVVVRLVCTLITLVLTPLDLYGEGDFSDMGKFYVYSVVLINLSQCWALYCLALVYFRFKKALHRLQPTKKFLVIKAIVFLCWWQGMVVSGMASAGWLEGTTEWTSDEVQRGLQDFLICVEMAIIAVVHHRVYSYLDFVPESNTEAPLLGLRDGERGAVPVGAAVPTQPAGPGPTRKPFLAAVANMMPGDVVRDVPRVLGARQASTTEIILSPPVAAHPRDTDEKGPGEPAGSIAAEDLVAPEADGAAPERDQV